MQGHTRRLLSTASLPSPVPTSCSSRAPGKGSFVSRCCLLTPGQTPTPSLLPQISLQNTLPKSRVLGGAEFRCPAEWHPCLSSAARHRCWRSGPWDLRICRLPLDRLPPPPSPLWGVTSAVQIVLWLSANQEEAFRTLTARMVATDVHFSWCTSGLAGILNYVHRNGLLGSSVGNAMHAD